MIQRKKILVVDDDPVNRFLVQDILRDYDVASVDSTAAMYKHIKTEEFPDLILLDVMLPEIDGFEAARYIKQEFDLHDVPIIFVTAKTEGEAVKRGFDSGAYDYVKKPFDSVEFISRVKNVLARSDKERKLRHEASTDPLTGLLNRRYFNDFVRKKISFCQRKDLNIALSMVDIDHFKLINDNYSHLAGDEVLIQFSELLVKSLRDYDVVARYGGEEFIIAFLDCTKQSAAAIFKRIQEELYQNPFYFQDRVIQFTFSAGISDLVECNENQEILTQLIAKADQRLYDAKESGRNKVVV